MSLMIVNELGKAYRTYKSEWHRFGRWMGIPCEPNEELWVLRHLNFEIQPGEAVGIVGENGAGKSTLLKMITGTLQPTEGAIQVNGRIAAILELGMGFNPELSGRENVFHAAGLMGFTSQQIQDAMADIEAFAEIGEYFDQPVRTYSSGMQMRVAFAVATAYRPEILIVDEALSVGDAHFQHKSFNRIREFRKQGTSLLIVSHDKQAIQSICDRAILLEGGQIAMEGEPEAVMDYYNAKLADHQNQTIKITQMPGGKQKLESGTKEAEITSIDLVDVNEHHVDVVHVGQDIAAIISVKVNSDINGLVLGLGVKDRLGQFIFGTNTYHTKQAIHGAKSGEIYTFVVSFKARLGVGSYSLHCSLVENDNHVEKNFYWVDRAKVFEVVNIDKPIFVGCSWNELTFQITKK